jgi:pimeloyl-ACP methyl ester carboxylesterase/DNA-binding CsgD family transcriptional regulator
MDMPPVRYVTTSDELKIAYCVAGEGRPLVFLPIPPNTSLEIAWRFPLPVRPWLDALSERFYLVHYDPRSVGLSTRVVQDTSIAGHLRDLDAVVQAVGLTRFVLFACSGFGHVAIRYAAENPDRTEALIIQTTPVSGRAWSRALFDALPEEDWQRFQQTQIPGGLSVEDQRRYLQLLMESGSSQEAVRAAIRAAVESSVEDVLPLLATPTLVIHPRDFPNLRTEESMRLAASIPNARMVMIEGRDVLGDPVQGLKAIDDFLETLPTTSGAATMTAAESIGLSQREIEILKLLATGKSNQEIANELVISLNTVRRHVSNVFDKTGAANRTQAAAYAKDRGLA